MGKSISRYKFWGYALAGAYASLQAVVYFLYYFPPANARELTQALITALPWIGGIRGMESLSIVGTRMALISAVAYVPFLCLGVLSVVREVVFKSKSWPTRPKWLDAVGVVLLIGIFVQVHYIGYWERAVWRNSISPMHGFAASFLPFFAGFTDGAFVFRLNKLFLKN